MSVNPMEQLILINAKKFIDLFGRISLLAYVVDHFATIIVIRNTIVKAFPKYFRTGGNYLGVRVALI